MIMQLLLYYIYRFGKKICKPPKIALSIFVILLSACLCTDILLMVLSSMDQPIWLIAINGFKLLVEIPGICYWACCRIKNLDINPEPEPPSLQL